jgi:hypothetical protein
MKTGEPRASQNFPIQAMPSTTVLADKPAAQQRATYRAAI